MLRFGLIGCGQHAKWALFSAFEKARNCRLCAVADLRPENLTAKEVPANVGRYVDYRAMLAKEALDAVYIATRVDAHCEPTVAALGAGLHVICEKPMADTVDKCRRMIAAARRAKRLLVIDFEMRYYAHHRKIKEWITRGYLGEIRAAHAQHFDARKAFGNGAPRRLISMNQNGVMNCGVHHLDLLRYFCGGDWSRIEARGLWFHEDTVYPVHQSLMAVLGRGVLVTFNASAAYGAYIASQVAGHDSITIVGAKGVIRASEGVVRLVSEAHSEEAPCEHPHHSVAIPRLLDDVADVVAGRKALAETPMATGDDGLVASRAMLEANRISVARRRDTNRAAGAKRTGKRQRAGAHVASGMGR